MAVKFVAIDLRMTEEGQKILEEGGGKNKKEKGAWAKGHGPTACTHCYGYCCGPNPYPKAGGKGVIRKHQGVQTEEGIIR